MDSVIFGALLFGLVIGAIPAIAGATKGKLGLGLGGFVSCVVGSLILGMILSIPACAIFMYLIFKKADNNTETTVDSVKPIAESPTEDLAWIRELQELRDSGALTESEFQESKAKILSKM